MALKNFFDKFKKNKFEKATKTVENKKTVKETYEEVLPQLIANMEFVNSTAEGGKTCMYIYPHSNANPDFIKEAFADMGINLKKHVSHLDNKTQEVLYITVSDMNKLTQEQKNFFDKFKKNKFENATKTVENKKTVKETYGEMLPQLIANAEFVNSTAEGGEMCIYIYPHSNANLDFIKEAFADMGINLKKHVSHLDNKTQEVLYITVSNVNKLTQEQKKFFDNITQKAINLHKKDYQR